MGPIILQGPHHSAQKSTNMGLSDLMMSSKFASVISIALAIIYFVLVFAKSTIKVVYIPFSSCSVIYFSVNALLSRQYIFQGIWGHYIPNLRSLDRKSTRLNSSHVRISYAVFC